ncbi:MAG: VOC family protein [Rhodoferax sp.]|nr:VOC family protein [Rhodoferax sp.]
MKVEPYLFFNGRCEEAMAFYQAALGAEVIFQMRMNEAPDPPPPGAIPAGFEDKVMHATLRIGELDVMVSDGNSDMQPSFKGFCLSLSVDTPEEAQRRFEALQQGGKVTMPMGKTFWSPAFGMVEDQFGVGWMVIVPTPN